MASYEERRNKIKANTKQIIKHAQTADRQSKLRARNIVKKSPAFSKMPQAGQEAVLKASDEKVMAFRKSSGVDMESKMTIAVDEECVELLKLKEEEEENLKKNLGIGQKRKASAFEDDDDADEEELIVQHTFTKRMKPFVQSLEAKILAGGLAGNPGITQDELNEFAKRVSDPELIFRAVKNPEEDEEEEGDEEEEEDDDIDSEDTTALQVVQSEDEDSDGVEDSDDEWQGFISDN